MCCCMSRIGRSMPWRHGFGNSRKPAPYAVVWGDMRAFRGRFAYNYPRVVQSTSIKSLWFSSFRKPQGPRGANRGLVVFLSRRSPCRITSFQLPFAAIPPCCPIWTVGRDPRSTRILVGHAVPDCADRAFCPWPAHAGKGSKQPPRALDPVVAACFEDEGSGAAVVFHCAFWSSGAES